MLNSKIRYGAWALLLVVMVPLAFADKDLPRDEEVEKTALVELGLGLVKYGQANEDALALANGIRMLNQVGAPIQEPGKGAEEVDRLALVEEARNYAGGDKTLNALLDEVQLETEEAGKPYYGCTWVYTYGYYGWGWYCI